MSKWPTQNQWPELYPRGIKIDMGVSENGENYKDTQDTQKWQFDAELGSLGKPKLLDKPVS